MSVIERVIECDFVLFVCEHSFSFHKALELDKVLIHIISEFLRLGTVFYLNYLVPTMPVTY